ncbi:AAA family ATPase [Lactococcus lactis]|uniref:AAA family ATPase n=1 Tax=Lactococcus lactis TaxID=1358 RepID=UPI0024A7F3CD|nr:AAA family ATPase [Lactococcus lactis]
MINEISLKKFKCYIDQRLKFSKINIISGTNSSGKSTILQAIKLFFVSENDDLLNLKKNKTWNFIGFKELVNNQDDIDSSSFEICINGERKTYKEYEYEGQPKNNYVSISGDKTQDNKLIFFHADSYTTSIQIQGTVEDGYYPKFNNETLADFIYSHTDPLKGTLKRDISNCLTKMGLISEELSVEKGLDFFQILIDDVDLKHVGTGVRHVLPIIVAVLTNKKTTFCIENPELHLHPRAQVEFMRTLFELSTINDNQLIIETHSDHIINTLRVLRKENFISQENLKVIFIGKKASIQNVEIDENGRYNKNLEGFFDEFEIQLERLL